MSTPSSHNITQLLIAWSDGDPAALEQLTPLVYKELHRLARRYMAGERPGHLLQTSALVNEAYMRLIDWKHVHWQNRAHFFGVAAKAMRHILVDYARSKSRGKRGGWQDRVTLVDDAAISSGRSAEIVALDDALNQLAALDERKVRVVEMKFFGGLKTEEIAGVLRVSPETVKRDWSFAQTWLLRELGR